ncbi:MAG: TIGR00341 family protein [Theionarchaea archaeon]|nr:TIGR00341 family protein [Theionarchaea archaeon]
MKKVLVTARKEDVKKVESILEDRLYFSTTKADLIQVTLYIHDKELNDIIDALRETIDLRYKECMIEVFTPDFIISPTLERTREKTSESKEETPVEKIIESTKPYLELDMSKIILTSVAGAIALTGLFMDNVAVIIGAMLLAPLLGPIYAFTINTAMGKGRDVFKSVGILAVLILMVVFFAFVITLLLDQVIELRLTDEILARMSSNPIYILMALLLGFASIIALSRDIPEGIAGVAVAAALLPPAAVAGISFVLYPSRMLAPCILTLQNVLGLMAGSLIATLLLNIGPRAYYKKVLAKKLIFRAMIVLLLLLLFLSVLSYFHIGGS